jgi:uncharacterized protein involved in tolerance to divalent cations
MKAYFQTGFYEVPCVISLPIGDAGSDAGYLSWIGRETGHG